MNLYIVYQNCTYKTHLMKLKKIIQNLKNIFEVPLTTLRFYTVLHRKPFSVLWIVRAAEFKPGTAALAVCRANTLQD